MVISYCINGFNTWPELTSDFDRRSLAILVALDPFVIEVFDLLQDDFGDIRCTNSLSGRSINHLSFKDGVHLLNHLLEKSNRFLIHFCFKVDHVNFELSLLLIRKVHSTTEAFGTNDNAIRSGRYFEFSFYHSQDRQYFWPLEKVENEETKKPRGGLPEMFLEESEEKEDPDTPKRLSLAEAMIQHSFGPMEIRRQLRSMAPVQLGLPLALDLYRALGQLETAAAGDAALSERLEREKEGEFARVRLHK